MEMEVQDHRTDRPLQVHVEEQEGAGELPEEGLRHRPAEG